MFTLLSLLLDRINTYQILSCVTTQYDGGKLSCKSIRGRKLWEKVKIFQRWFHQNDLCSHGHSFFFVFLPLLAEKSSFILRDSQTGTVMDVKVKLSFEGPCWGKAATQSCPGGGHRFPACFSSSWIRLNIVKGSGDEISGLEFCPFELFECSQRYMGNPSLWRPSSSKTMKSGMWLIYFFCI